MKEGYVTLHDGTTAHVGLCVDFFNEDTGMDEYALETDCVLLDDLEYVLKKDAEECLDCYRWFRREEITAGICDQCDELENI